MIEHIIFSRDQLDIINEYLTTDIEVKFDMTDIGYVKTLKIDNLQRYKINMQEFYTVTSISNDSNVVTNFETTYSNTEEHALINHNKDLVKLIEKTEKRKAMDKS